MAYMGTYQIEMKIILLTANKKYCQKDILLLNKVQMLHGVLGSVLGPFLFLVYQYINNITFYLDNHIRLFADDTSFFVIIDSDAIGSAISLTNDLEIFFKKKTQWLVEFNPTKTVNVFFTRSDKSHSDISFGHTFIAVISDLFFNQMLVGLSILEIFLIKHVNV